MRGDPFERHRFPRDVILLARPLALPVSALLPGCPRSDGGARDHGRPGYGLSPGLDVQPPSSRCPPTITAARGERRHLWRSVDYEGRFIDVRLIAKCDAKAAAASFERTSQRRSSGPCLPRRPDAQPRSPNSLSVSQCNRPHERASDRTGGFLRYDISPYSALTRGQCPMSHFGGSGRRTPLRLTHRPQPCAGKLGVIRDSGIRTKRDPEAGRSSRSHER